MKGKHTGTITFYSRIGDKLYTRKYNSRQRRQELIDFARKLYGQQFRTMYYQVAPDETRLLNRRFMKPAA